MLTDTASTASTDTATTDIAPAPAAPAQESEASRRTRLYESRTCEVRLTRRALRGALIAARAHASEDTGTRKHMCSVAFTVSKVAPALELVATDGLSLARVRMFATEIANADALPTARLNVNAIAVDNMIKALTFKRKADGDALVTLGMHGIDKSDRSGRFASGHVTLAIAGAAPFECTLLDMQYPDILQLLGSVNYESTTKRGPSHVGGLPIGSDKRACSVGVNPEILARACEVARHMGREWGATIGIVMELGSCDLDPIKLSWADPLIGEYLGLVMPMRR